MDLQPWPEPIRRMPDGTIKQLNPYSGTSVWTVPHRGDRPLTAYPTEPRELDQSQQGRFCAFCELRYLDTPPEKSRLEWDGAWHQRDGLTCEQVSSRVAEFRRIPNLFEIVSFDYWRTNYAYDPPAEIRARYATYLSTQAGRAHVTAMTRTRALAEGLTQADWLALSDEQRAVRALAFFAGGHDVIVARRHFLDGAVLDDQLASSGSLTPDEHGHYIAFTVDAMRSLYATNRYARYVAVFQNWLRPAGASFGHLHKQLVAVDERSIRMETELSRLRNNLNLYNEFAVDYAARQNLILAENEHAVAFAGFGHRYPSLEVYSKSRGCRPWHHTDAEVRAVSDLLHACHAATGPEIACNEEWHHQAPDMDVPMPWRMVLKWRVSTLAGFEGGTKIYLNTIDPWQLRDRVVPRLLELRASGRIAPNMQIATECDCRPNS
ncbi:MAG: DUF4921 family protein, partial [Dermatophilaceae bacterium]